ncbi:MAG: polysaccharide biosynthesis protein [Chlorobi bacterium OLB4]|jgi:O-antigen/teichoic acid export membrane protein|nr:MAG: polysaccharide biosynthesis protein [Chlorobi bacterium OLB4]MBW7855810.1 oligosaccharide flippase family protein [Ignavibacteria bacterium]OQY76546.1 MAG: hypothetical protein B6D43_10225 [Ignavibacteriales bacterium UTCHB1]
MLEKIKSLSQDTVIYGISTMVSRFFTFLLVPFYTNVFPPSDYGIITNVFAYIAMLNVFFSIGLESGYFKFASTLELGDRKENFSQPFIIIFTNSFVLSVLIFFFAPNLTGIFLLSSSQSLLVKLAAAILFFDAICLVPFAYLRLQRKAKKFALLKVINICIMFILNLILILVLKLGIEAVFIGNLIASAVTFILLIPDVLTNLRLSLNKHLIRELIFFSLPYIPAGIASNIIQVINRPLLLKYSGEETLGIFQANYKLGIFVMLFVSIFEFAWRPFFLNHAKDPDAKNLFSKVLTLFVIAASTLFLVISLYIPDVVKMELPFKGNLIGEKYWVGLNIVPVVLFSYILYGIYINLMAGIYIEKKTKYLPLITGIAAVTCIASNAILIPLFGMIGSAFATFLSYLMMMIFIYYFSQKYYHVNYEKSKIVSILLLAVVFYLPTYILEFNGALNLIFKTILLMIFIGVLNFTGLFKLSSLKNLRV